MEQLKVNYDFYSEKDLRDKADPFVERLETMRERHEQLKTFIASELKQSKGNVVEKALTSMETQHQNLENTISVFQDVMKRAAVTYTEHINDMRRQQVTVYYEVIEKTVTS